MIRSYKDGDFDNFISNGLSLGIEDVDLNELVDKDKCFIFTDKKDKIKIILFVLEYAKRCYYGFIWASKEVNAHDVIELRDFINMKSKELKAIRLETQSLSNNMMDNYHEFLGFTCEGTKKNYRGDGQDHKIWSMLWE